MFGRQLVRIGSLILGCQAVNVVVGVVALRVFTALVPGAVFGESNLILSALGLGSQLFVAAFTAVQLRYYTAAAARSAGDDFTRETMTWALRATGVLAVIAVCVLAVGRAAGRMTSGWPVLLSVVGWLFATTVRNVLMTRVQAERRQAPYALLQVLETLLLMGTTAAALRQWPTVVTYIASQAVATTVLVGVLVVATGRNLGVFRQKRRADSDFLRRAWSYGLPFAPMAFFGWLANLGDRYTLAYLLGPSAAGFYIAPFSIASRGMTVAGSALSDLFRPLLFDAENRRAYREAHRLFVNYVLCSVAIGIVGLVLIYTAGDLIARLLLAPAYRVDATPVMLWVSLGYAIYGVTRVLENRVLSLGISNRLLAPMLLGAVANVAFSFVLIRHSGIKGAAQATCASFVAQAIATLVFLIHAQRKLATSGTRELPVEIA